MTELSNMIEHTIYFCISFKHTHTQMIVSLALMHTYLLFRFLLCPTPASRVQDGLQQFSKQ